MQLPDPVKRIIEERADAVGFAAVKRAADEMSNAYREGAPLRVTTPARVAAYLATRMPATYAAAHAALSEIAPCIGAITSLLDIGAGSGAASLAARAYYPDASLTLLDRDPDLLAAARDWLPGACIQHGDAAQMLSLPPHDLVIAAYSLGELQGHIAGRLWQAARIALVVIEPGTPAGFAGILGVRDELLASGAHMAAPCPAAMPCPAAAPDWCHFAARVERSSLHRRLKGADLGYEDEKYSYIALSRTPVSLPRARIVRRPEHHPGWIALQTCTAAGLAGERVAKRDRDSFRAARRARWGEALS